MKIILSLTNARPRSHRLQRQTLGGRSKKGLPENPAVQYDKQMVSRRLTEGWYGGAETN
jgi:hypothetical protein